jgi:hypothetical protein
MRYNENKKEVMEYEGRKTKIFPPHKGKGVR